MGLTSALAIGRSALNASQVAMQVTGRTRWRERFTPAAPATGTAPRA